MGWDTYLRIGHLLSSWRKHSPHLAVLLFREEEFSWSGTLDDDAQAADPASARMCSTVGRCLDRLAEVGFDWQFIVSAYGETREGLGYQSRGALIAAAHGEGQTPQAVEQTAARFSSLPPATDLLALAK